MNRPLGYAWLNRHYKFNTRPLLHSSFLGTTRSTKERANGTVEEHYVRRYDPGEDPLDQLVFALKYDGIELDIMRRVFERITPEEVADFVARTPTGRYARQIGCWFETLTGREVPLVAGAGTARLRYAPLLDPRLYVVASNPVRDAKWQINNNVIGDRRFLPIIRRTRAIQAAEKTDWNSLISETVNRFPADVLRRALSYLYFKETRSSFAIEREEPSENRTSRFVALLHRAGGEGHPIDERVLTDLQNAIVDDRFREDGYRTIQNYIGHGGIGREVVDSIGAPPGYVRDVMDGLRAYFDASVDVHPVIRAAVVSFAFVFVHPFVDGNGRIHRYLIHDIMARGGIGGNGLILPVSAEILADRTGYDTCLERFSKGLISIAEWHFGKQHEMVVENPDEIEGCYRFPDLSAQVEYLAKMVGQSIENSLVGEIELLERMDHARESIREIVDLPDRLMDSLLARLHRNNGKLARKRREGEFRKLTDDEVDRIEEAFAGVFGF